MCILDTLMLSAPALYQPRPASPDAIRARVDSTGGKYARETSQAAANPMTATAGARAFPLVLKVEKPVRSI